MYTVQSGKYVTVSQSTRWSSAVSSMRDSGRSTFFKLQSKVDLTDRPTVSVLCRAKKTSICILFTIENNAFSATAQYSSAAQM